MAIAMQSVSTATGGQTVPTPPIAPSGGAADARPSASTRGGHQMQPLATSGPSYSPAVTVSAADPARVSGVTPDVDGDGARLMALDVQQGLNAQGGPIASAQSQSILALFKS